MTSAMLSVLFKQRLVLVDPATGLALPPAEVLAAVNRSICEAHAAPGLFLTAVFGLLDTSDASLTLASAGHPPVLHARDGRETRLIRRTGPALGLAPDAHFQQKRLQHEFRLLLPHVPQHLQAAHFVVGQHQVEGLPLQGGCEVLPRSHPHDVAGKILVSVQLSHLEIAW